MSHRLTRSGRWRNAVLSGLALALAPAGSARAGEAAAPAPAASTAEAKLPRVNLYVKNEELSAVLKQIQEQTQINVVADPEIAGERVTVEVTGMLVDDVLSRVLTKQVKGLQIDKVSNNFYQLHRPPTVSMSLEGAPIQNVIKMISQLSGVNIIVAPGVTGNVTMSLRNVPWEEALRTVAGTYGYAVVAGESKQLYSVVDPRTLTQQSLTRTFKLRFIQPPGTYRPKLKSEVAFGTPTAPSEDYKTSFPLMRSLQSVLSPVGKIDFDKDSNALIVTDIATKLDEIAKIVEQVDKKPPQVKVSVKFISHNETDGLDFGFDWEKGFTARLTGASVPSRLPFKTGRGGFEDFFTPFGGNDGSNEGPPALAPVAPTVPVTTWGILSFTETIITLKALQTRKDITISQQPEIVALDNQETTIFVGETIRYAEAVVQQGTGGGTIVSGIQESARSPVNVGFQLLIQPHIIPETGEVLLTLIPEQNTLSGTGKNITGFDTFTAAGQTIDLPRVATRSLVTKVLLQSGQTVVIGGLIDDNRSETVNEVPIVSQIPLLGWLFRSRGYTNEKKKLTIFATVDVVKDFDEAGRAVDEALGRKKAAPKGQ